MQLSDAAPNPKFYELVQKFAWHKLKRYTKRALLQFDDRNHLIRLEGDRDVKRAAPNKHRRRYVLRRVTVTHLQWELHSNHHTVPQFSDDITENAMAKGHNRYQTRNTCR